LSNYALFEGNLPMSRIERVERVEPGDLREGDHLYIVCKLPLGAWFQHHGIYLGNLQVMHYATRFPDFKDGEVKIASLTQFQKFNGRKNRLHRIRYAGAEAGDRIVARAHRRMGEKEYHLTRNNCEHFANWCATGKATCKQHDIFCGVLNLVNGTLVGPAKKTVRVARRVKAGTMRTVKRAAGRVSSMFAHRSSSGPNVDADFGE
jgi:Lecithin retinol acyltransferase